MFNRILVPLDGSELAEEEILAAFCLAGRGDEEIRFLYVVEPVPVEADYAPVEPVDREWAECYLAKMSERAPRGWQGTIEMSVRDGHAAEQIIAEAGEWQADVIVMATHGRGGVSRAWMGSVTDRCIRCSPCPVLAIRSSESGGWKPLTRNRIVVPLDGSVLAEAALPYGASLAKQFDMPLLLFEALVFSRIGGSSSVTEAVDLSEQASAYLKNHRDRLREQGLDVKLSVRSDRSAAHAILACAGGDLVVMSTHGRTGLARAISGSVADKVIRGTTGAVLVIPSQESLRPVRLRGSQVTV